MFTSEREEFSNLTTNKNLYSILARYLGQIEWVQEKICQGKGGRQRIVIGSKPGDSRLALVRVFWEVAVKMQRIEANQPGR